MVTAKKNRTTLELIDEAPWTLLITFTAQIPFSRGQPQLWRTVRSREKTTCFLAIASDLPDTSTGSLTQEQAEQQFGLTKSKLEHKVQSSCKIPVLQSETKSG